MLVDSGASCNILPIKLLPKGTVIKKSDKTLSMYSKSTMSAVGTSSIEINNPKNGQRYNLDFVIVKGDYTPLIGLQAALKIKLIEIHKENILTVDEEYTTVKGLTKDEVLNEYSDVFGNELGHMEGKVHLYVDPSEKITVSPPRKVPPSMKTDLKEEIDRQTKRQVISPVDTPTDWVSSLTTVRKQNGDIRLCIDPQPLNIALKRCHYPLPTIEDLLPELSQAKLDQNLEGLNGVFKIADDILITGQGTDDESANRDHDKNLKNLLERCRKKNIKLNKAKFEFKCDEVTFIGHRLTKEGLKPDPNKINAILNMKRPEDVAAVQRLLGMTKYLSKFLKDLSQMSEPLRRLTHKDVQFVWTKEHEQSFNDIKKAISSAPILKYFDSSKTTEGSGDASQKGRGFVLTQDYHPITYATPKRPQRLLLRLQNYDLDIKFRPGDQMYLADTLSSAYLDTSTDTLSETEKEVESIHAVDYLAISEPQLKEIKSETAKDSTLQLLKNTILQGWPDDRVSVPETVKPYFNFRDELAVHDGIVFKGTRCVVPISLRQNIKEKLHRSHIGIQGCLRRAREVVYWPLMNQEFKDYIEHCEICSMFASHQQKEPLIVHDVPQRPWQKIGCDIFTLYQRLSLYGPEEKSTTPKKKMTTTITNDEPNTTIATNDETNTTTATNDEPNTTTTTSDYNRDTNNNNSDSASNPENKRKKLDVDSNRHAVAYVSDQNILVFGIVRENRKNLHGHSIPEDCVCVEVTFVKHKEIPAPVVLGDANENSFLSVGLYFAFPKIKLYVFENRESPLRPLISFTK
ncbi:Transposon Tf2-6 polyprotein [Exaiptasia diaphana]|nr:Transposon Tf2-6 polyprotein [Exaiptasia diaphana]